MKGKDKINYNKLILIVLPLIVFTLLSVSSIPIVMATHTATVKLDDGTDRIVQTAQTGTTLILNVTSGAGSTHKIDEIDITNATGYIITTVSGSGSSWSCSIGNSYTNCTNATADSAISPGAIGILTLTVNSPSISSTGSKQWHVQTNDTNKNVVGYYLYTLAIDIGSIGFDIGDELGNILNGTTVHLFSPAGSLTINTANVTDVGLVNDDWPDGLVIFDNGGEVTGLADATFKYNISLDGMVNVSSGTVNYLRDTNPKFTAIKPTGLQYGIKITVVNELGTALTSGLAINITNATTNHTATAPLVFDKTPNVTDGNNYYYCLDKIKFKNITVTVNKTGYITNMTASTFYLTSGTAQQTAGSSIILPYSLKATVQNELGGNANMNTGLTFVTNGTSYTSENVNWVRSSNVYYFNLTSAGYNVTVGKVGYVNTTGGGSAGFPVNTTLQASQTIQLPFTLKLNITDEIYVSPLAASAATYNLTTATNTSGSFAYLALDPATYGSSVLENVTLSGYVTKNSANVLINTSAQGKDTVSLQYNIKVLAVCDELNVSCFTIDGIVSFVEATGFKTNYSTYAYIPATGIVNVIAGKSGYVNTTKSVTTDGLTQQTLAFNETNYTQVAVLNNNGGLDYTIKVASMCDELNETCFTIDGTTNQYSKGGVQASLLGTTNKTAYNGGNAYINATGALTLVAFAQGFVNRSQSVTPTPGSAQVNANFNSTYPLQFPLKVTVTDELGPGLTGASIGLNKTWKNGRTIGSFIGDYVPNSNNYYFNLTAAYYNITAGKSGYVNTTDANLAAIIPVNASAQATSKISLPFTLKLNITDEIYVSPLAASAATYNLTTATNTSGTFAYFALDPATYGSSVLENVTLSGYVTKNSANVLINTSAQGKDTVSLQYNIKVLAVCDELNVSCFTIDGIVSFVEATGFKTNYSTYAYIPATGIVNVIAGKSGYVNTTKSVTTDGLTQQTLAFNETNYTQVAVLNNNGGLDYTIKVASMCDELNETCFTIDGTTNQYSKGGVQASLLGTTNKTAYNGGNAYINATGALTLVAFAQGFVNRSQSVTPTPGSAQVNANFNSTYPLQFPLKVTVTDELGAGITSAVIALNNSWKIGRTSGNFIGDYVPNSNNYYFNLTAEHYTISAAKVGYINTSIGSTTAAILVNSTTQATGTLRLPFSVKVHTQSSGGSAVTGSVVDLYNDTNTFTATDGSTHDANTSADGYIYWAFNESDLLGTINARVRKNGYQAVIYYNKNINTSTQLVITTILYKTAEGEDTTVPTITINSPTAGTNTSSTTPTITFALADSLDGSGIDASTIVVIGVSGFNALTHCPGVADSVMNVTCTFTPTALTDGSNYTINIFTKDMAGNSATNATAIIGIDSHNTITVTAITANKTTAVANGTDYWEYTFQITVGNTAGNATRFKMSDWTDGAGHTIAVSGYATVSYKNATGQTNTYNIKNAYNTSETIYQLYDNDATTTGIQGVLTIRQIIPTNTASASYSTTYGINSYTVGISGG